MIGAATRYAAGALLAMALPIGLALASVQSLASRVWEQERIARLEETVTGARAALDTVDAQDAAAVASLCRDDLWIDAWMQALAEGDSDRERTLARQLEPRARALGFGALAVLEAGPRTGRLLGAYPARGLDPGAIRRELARDPALPFVHAEGRQAPALGWRLHLCRGARAGASLVVVGGRALADDARPWRLLADRGESRLHLTGRDGALPPGLDAPDARRRVAAFHDASGASVAQWVAILPHADAPPVALDPALLAIVLAVAALGALILGLVVARRLAGPLADLETAARRVAGGDLGTPVGDTHGGTARRTATAFNEMTEELGRARGRLRRAERVAAWKDIARQIAHEIKNPLSPIQVSIETMRKTYAKRHPDFDEIFEESTLTILEEVERLKRIVTEFSQFARMPRPRPEVLALEELVEHVASLHRGGSVRVAVDAPPRGSVAPVRADREQITQVLVNLVKNGVEAARSRHGESGGTVRVRVRPDPAGVVIAVQDDGPGIAEEHRDRIFEPYFTTKSEGTGLGLAIAFRIVEDHGGSLELEPNEAGGATFRMFLPSEGPPPEPETLTESPLRSSSA